MRKKLLTEPTTYFFYALHGIDVSTISKLNHSQFNVYGVKINTNEFNQLKKEILGFEITISRKEPKALYSEWESFIKHYHADKQLYILYSPDLEALNRFYQFLLLIHPADIRFWAQFEAMYSKDEDQNEEYTLGSFAQWAIGQVYYQNKPMLSLEKENATILNNLLAKFFQIERPPFIDDLLGMYEEAYREERFYFKYLFFFMIIESLIVDDEKTGVVFKIRRLCAVLVGDTKENSVDIFKKVRTAYEMRSALVHSAKSIIHQKALNFVHSLLCEVLLMIVIIEPDKNDIFNLTNEHAFGSKKSLIKERRLKKYTLLATNKHNLQSINTKLK